MDTRVLGRWIMQQREQRGWSRDELGRLTHLHPNTIRNIELGAESMQLRTVSAIAEALGLDVTEMLEQGQKPTRRRRDGHTTKAS